MQAAYLAHLKEDGNCQALRAHLLSVSEMAGQRAERVGLGAAGGLIGLLHDLGKYSGDFQRYLRSATTEQDTESPQLERGSVDHSTAGAQTIWRHLKPRGEREAIVAEILAICVASHHSGLIDCVEPSGTERLSKRMEKADELSHCAEALVSAEQEITQHRDAIFNDPALVRDVCEAVGGIYRNDSSETIRQFKVGLLVRLLFSCLIDADRTETADSAEPGDAVHRQHGCYTRWPILIRRLEDRLSEFPCESSIDRLRHQVSSACLASAVRDKGTYTLTVPTGGGKTLASLRFAMNHAQKWGMERVIYVSPYTSIIDQNAEVVRGILEPKGTAFASVVLEHHSNLTPLKQTRKSKILAENWDSPIVFTTAVQVLEALFGSGTRAVRRMHQMANSVLIFDEVQTIPVRCVHMFNNAANFLVEQCRSTVLLCTATQPLLHRVDIHKGAIRLGNDAANNADIVPNASGLFAAARRCETVDRRQSPPWEYGAAAEFAISEARRSRSCLVIVNMKREAKAIFIECQKTAADDTLCFHLSTNMCPAHRRAILAEVKCRLRQHEPVICVSTQLIEAGVDISFASAIRAIAGIDSIAQAAGRCNRHGELSSGRVSVINLVGVLPNSLPDIRKAQEAGQRVLDENKTTDNQAFDVSDPALVEQYFRYYFFDRRGEMDYKVGPTQAERDDSLLNMLGRNRLAVVSCKPHPSTWLRQAFMTAGKVFQAIDASTRGIIIPYAAAGKSIIAELGGTLLPPQQMAILKSAQQFTVSVFPNVLQTLERMGAVREVSPGTGILYLDERYYNNDFGIDIEGLGKLELLNA